MLIFDMPYIFETTYYNKTCPSQKIFQMMKMSIFRLFDVSNKV